MCKYDKYLYNRNVHRFAENNKQAESRKVFCMVEIYNYTNTHAHPQQRHSVQQQQHKAVADVVYDNRINITVEENTIAQNPIG